MRLSVLIKTYNEGGKIAKCIKSVLDSVREIEGGVEIVVADSLSTDDTVEIAKNYDVKVVQLRAAEDRGCGTGVQLRFPAYPPAFSIALRRYNPPPGKHANSP